jgi:hypothetical protein
MSSSFTSLVSVVLSGAAQVRYAGDNITLIKTAAEPHVTTSAELLSHLQLPDRKQHKRKLSDPLLLRPPSFYNLASISRITLSQHLEMPELITLPGLNSYIVELQGILTYTHTRKSRSPQTYQIAGADLDNGNCSDISSAERKNDLKPGLDASAVSIKFRLMKNDGVLKMEYEGKNGGMAVWTFQGMGMVGGAKMIAAAATQTDVDPNNSSTCGEEKKNEVEVKQDEVQTDIAAMQSTGIQTMMVAMINTGTQATPPEIHLHHRASNALEILGPYIDTAAAKSIVQWGLNGSKQGTRAVSAYDKHFRGSTNDS